MKNKVVRGLTAWFMFGAAACFLCGFSWSHFWAGIIAAIAVTALVDEEMTGSWTIE